MNGAPRTPSFSDRVVVLFGTQVFMTGVGIVNGFLIARWLGPAGKGEYYLLTLLPAILMVLLQLGLPEAFGFFAARGQTAGIVEKTVTLSAILAVTAFVAALAVLPLLLRTFMRGLQPSFVILALLGLPLVFNVEFTTGIVLGRQAVRWNAVFSAATSASATISLVVLIGVLGFGVEGAVAAWLLTYLVQAVGFLVAAARVSAAVRQPDRVTYHDLFRYSLPLYPGSTTLFFSDRADVLLLALLLASPAAPLGYYSLAVTLAGMVFFLPSAVSTLFFPHVAGAGREESDRQVPMLSRVTLLVASSAALLLAPVATLLIRLLLPAFWPSVPAFYVLLPAVVALSVGRVLTGYIMGLGHTAIASIVNVGAFAANLLANLLLIPRFGILGASAASLISYSVSSAAFTLVAARLAKVRAVDFWLPRWDDVRLTIATSITLARRILQRATGEI